MTALSALALDATLRRSLFEGCVIELRRSEGEIPERCYPYWHDWNADPEHLRDFDSFIDDGKENLIEIAYYGLEVPIDIVNSWLKERGMTLEQFKQPVDRVPGETLLEYMMRQDIQPLEATGE